MSSVHNLPFPRSGFVGRTEERTALGSLLRTEGVVSVVGLGGVGKTRLAIQLAFDVMDRFPDGAWLVELAALSDPASVPRAVAEATRVAEKPGRSIDEVLIEALADKVALLVLDNCEHLLDAVADIAERLSRHCPHLVILATSREPLDIEGEVVWRLSPLPVVEPGGVERAAEVAAAESVRLFVERARSVNPRFELTDDNAADVARIVAQLNGIPLAIELAAAALGDRPLSGVRHRACRPLLVVDPRAADRTASPPDAPGGVGVEPRPAPKRRAPPVRSARRIRRRRGPPRRSPTCAAACPIADGDVARNAPPPGSRLADRPASRAAGTLVDARVGPRARGHRAGGGRRGRHCWPLAIEPGLRCGSSGWNPRSAAPVDRR